MPDLVDDDLPSHWRLVRLGDYCQRPEYGFTGRAVEDHIGPSLLRITDIEEGSVNWNKVPFVDLAPEKARRYRLIPDDLVVARIGASTGKALLVRECPDAVFASYLIRIRTKPDLLPAFLELFCNGSRYWQHIRQHKGGRLKGGVTIPILETLRVPLPPLPEQRAIARALRAVQEAKEARHRELVLERERKAALMEFLFTNGTRGEPTKMTEIGEMPDTWRAVRIGEIASDLGSGITPRGGEKTYLKAGIPLIRSQNVKMNSLCLDDVAYISLETHEAMSRSAVRPGDVLLNITGASIGRVAFVPNGIKVANVNQHVCRIHLIQEAVPHFVSYFLSTPQGQARIMGSQFGTTRQGLNYGNVRALRLPLPPVEEQRRIANVLLACDTNTTALEREMKLLDEFFRAILEELMTGRLSAVPLIEQEAAS